MDDFFNAKSLSLTERDETGEKLSSLKAEEPTWRLCNHDVPKKVAIVAITKFLLFIGMMIYITYQMYKYFNPNINRKEYINEVLVDNYPFAYIYLAYLANGTVCNDTFGFYNGTTYSVTESYYEWVDGEDDDMTIEEMFDYVDNDNNCRGVFVKKAEMVDNDLYMTYLFIPSECELMRSGSKDFHFGRLSCVNSSVMPSDGIIWFAANHRDQLLYYDNFNDVMYDLFWHETIYVRLGYDMKLSPKWISYKNELDSGDYYDYYELQTDSIEYMLYDYDTDIEHRGLINNSRIVSGTSLFRIHPHDIGTKFEYITTYSLDILDILGLAGGMYSTIDQVLNYIAFAAIWGFSFGFIKFGGIATDAAPNKLMQTQLDAFLKKRDEAMREFQKRIIKLEKNNNIHHHDHHTYHSPMTNNQKSNLLGVNGNNTSDNIISENNNESTTVQTSNNGDGNGNNNNSGVLGRTDVTNENLGEMTQSGDSNSVSKGNDSNHNNHNDNNSGNIIASNDSNNINNNDGNMNNDNNNNNSKLSSDDNANNFSNGVTIRGRASLSDTEIKELANTVTAIDEYMHSDV